MSDIVVIQASHYRQACLVADNLGIPQPDGRHGVFYAHEPQRVMGIRPDRVIFAYPRLEQTIVDHVQHDAVREALLTRAAQAGITVERVTT